MSIQVCRACAGVGHLRKIYPSDEIDPFFPHRYQIREMEMPCETCGGASKWRPKNESFTLLENMPPEVIADLAKIMPWVHINEEQGRLWFIAGPGLPENEDSLIFLLKKTSSIGRVFEENNWLVYY